MGKGISTKDMAGMFVLFSPILFVLTGCLGEEKTTKVENIEEKLEGVAFDTNRALKYLAIEKDNLAAYEKARKDLRVAGPLAAELEDVVEQVKVGEERNKKLAGEIRAARSALKDYQANYRAKIRKAAEGTLVDLSESKGEDYREAKILSVTLQGITVFRNTGPELVPLKDLPSGLLDRFQLDEKAGP